MFSFWPLAPWKQTTIKVKMVLNKYVKQKPIGAEKEQVKAKFSQEAKTYVPK